MPAVSTVIPISPEKPHMPSCDEPKTIVVLGAARGGTSMVAGLVRMLGIDMGERLDPPTNEDLDFIEGREPLIAITDSKHPEHTPVLERLLGIVNARNQKHGDWGWKDPLAFVYVAPLIPFLRNPHFVVIFRDLFSVSAREKVATGVDTMGTLSRAQKNYAWIQEVLKRREAPALITGYEKVLLYPETYARDLQAFLGQAPDEKFVQDAVAYIKPGRGSGILKPI